MYFFYRWPPTIAMFSHSSSYKDVAMSLLWSKADINRPTNREGKTGDYAHAHTHTHTHTHAMPAGITRLEMKWKVGAEPRFIESGVYRDTHI